MDRKNLYDQPVSSNVKQHKYIRMLTTVQAEN